MTTNRSVYLIKPVMMLLIQCERSRRLYLLGLNHSYRQKILQRILSNIFISDSFLPSTVFKTVDKFRSALKRSERSMEKQPSRAADISAHELPERTEEWSSPEIKSENSFDNTSGVVQLVTPEEIKYFFFSHVRMILTVTTVAAHLVSHLTMKNRNNCGLQLKMTKMLTITLWRLFRKMND